MPAMTGEPFRGLSKVKLTDAGGGRAFTASLVDVVPDTATGHQNGTGVTAWEQAPGATTTLRIEWDTNGTSTLAAPEEVVVSVHRVLNGAVGVQLGNSQTVTINSASGSSTLTFGFTRLPLETSIDNLAAMFYVDILVRRLTPTAWTAGSDGRQTGSALSGVTHDWARGYLRAPHKLSTLTVHEATLGSHRDPASFAFQAYDPTFTRVTVVEVNSISGQASLTLEHLKQDNALIRTQAITSGTTVNDYSWNLAAVGTTGRGRINKDYPASLSDIKNRLKWPTGNFGGDICDVWATAGQPSGWSVLAGSEHTLEHAGSLKTDPRISFTQLLQNNDSAFGTPPSSKNVANGRRLTTDLSFIAARATLARSGAPADGALAWTEKLWDAGQFVGTEASPVKSRACTSATKGGEAGWADGFLAWDNQLPGGNWTQKEVITTSEFTGLEVTNTRTLALLAFDGEIVVLAMACDPATPDEHWFPGKQLLITTLASKNGISLSIDSARAWIRRRKTGAGGDVTFEYWNPTTKTWAEGNPGDANAVTLTASADNANAYRVIIPATDTVGWNTSEVSIIVEAVVSGTPYKDVHNLTVVGSKWRHGANEPESSVTFADGGHDHTGGVEGDSIARGGSMGAVLILQHTQGGNHDVFIAYPKPSTGDVYDNTEVTALSFQVLDRTGLVLLASTAASWVAALGAWRCTFADSILPAGIRGCILKATPTRAGGIPAALTPIARIPLLPASVLAEEDQTQADVAAARTALQAKHDTTQAAVANVDADLAAALTQLTAEHDATQSMVQQINGAANALLYGPQTMTVPDTGSRTYRFRFRLRDLDQTPVALIDPDGNVVTLTATDPLGNPPPGVTIPNAGAMTRDGAGDYRIDVVVDSTAVNDNRQVVFKAAWARGGVADSVLLVSSLVDIDPQLARIENNTNSILSRVGVSTDASSVFTLFGRHQRTKEELAAARAAIEAAVEQVRLALVELDGDVGEPADVASETGTAHAKLTALLQQLETLQTDVNAITLFYQPAGFDFG